MDQNASKRGFTLVAIIVWAILSGLLLLGAFPLMWGMGMSEGGGNHASKFVIGLPFAISTPGIGLITFLGLNSFFGIFLAGALSFLFWIGIYYAFKHMWVEARQLPPISRTIVRIVALMIAVGPAFICLFHNPLTGPRMSQNHARLVDLIQRGETQAAVALLDNGADPSSADSFTGDTPLHIAAGGGFVDMVEVLLKHGAKVDAINSTAMTPMLLAVKAESLPSVHLLIKYKANVNLSQEDFHKGYTPPPLLEAVSKGNLEITKALVNSGADLNYNGIGPEHTPLAEAKWKGNKEVVEYLISKGAK